VTHIRFLLIVLFLAVGILFTGGCAGIPTINGEPAEIITVDYETKYA